MATADLTVLALGRPDVSASEYIAEIQRWLAAQDRVRYRLHAMGTSLEGSTEDILAVVGELHAVPFEQGVRRVYTILKLDARIALVRRSLDSLEVSLRVAHRADQVRLRALRIARRVEAAEIVPEIVE